MVVDFDGKDVGCSRPLLDLEGQYTLGETIGSGGFGKVKLATHVLTGEKCAIKIIDKEAIGEDLPRITTELRALKKLWHQNVCRLYQAVETEKKFYIVLEYCSGGELFDYIVKKECLPEPESRHFFRQIVSAVSYVHHMGFAHRDLKPENLLLTDDLQLKLIDFGLCANPESGLRNVLRTCCGSPAYAAPELIKGEEYFGNEADIWSMGVLLYALLCGFLPFEDENVQSLYNKITLGRYPEPPWLSDGSKTILRAMLQRDPRKRITIEQLLVHPWVVRDYSQPLKWRSIYDTNIVDEEICKEMARHFQISFKDMLDQIRLWKYDHMSAVYFLLLTRKRRKQPVWLPLPPKSKSGLKPSLSRESSSSVLHSPTIHASLESGLDKVDDEFDYAFLANDEATDTNDLLAASTIDSFKQTKVSYVCAVRNEARKTEITPVSTKVRTRMIQKYNESNKENKAPRPPFPASSRKPQQKQTDDKNGYYIRPKSVYATPHGHFSAPVTPKDKQKSHQNWAQETPLSVHLRVQSSEDVDSDRLSEIEDSPTKDVGENGGENGASARTPRSKTKTPVFSRKVFASVERKVDRVINMLTPRRTRPETPAKLRRTKTLVNVSTTSSSDPSLVLQELIRIFQAKGIMCEQQGWKISGKAKDTRGRVSLTLELEVVLIEHLDIVGVRRKRLNGDSFMYKRVCEDILNLASL